MQAESRGESLTEDECRDVLARIKHKHDCNTGINWDFIDYWIEDVIKDREAV